MFLPCSILQIKSDAFGRNIFERAPHHMDSKTLSSTSSVFWISSRSGLTLLLSFFACSLFALRTRQPYNVLCFTSLRGILASPSGSVIGQNSVLSLIKSSRHSSVVSISTAKTSWLRFRVKDRTTCSRSLHWASEHAEFCTILGAFIIG